MEFHEEKKSYNRKSLLTLNNRFFLKSNYSDILNLRLASPCYNSFVLALNCRNFYCSVTKRFQGADMECRLYNMQCTWKSHLVYKSVLTDAEGFVPFHLWCHLFVLAKTTLSSWKWIIEAKLNLWYTHTPRGACSAAPQRWETMCPAHVDTGDIGQIVHPLSEQTGMPLYVVTALKEPQHGKDRTWINKR